MNVLIAGVTGITGSYIARHLQRCGASVTGLARRPFAVSDATVPLIQGDLSSPETLDALKQAGQSFSHLVYSGFSSVPGASWEEVSAWNTRLFDNLLDVAEHHMPNLQRVLLMQGQKYYGSHLGPFDTPTLETDPRHPGTNFYFDQQDHLTERAGRCRWSCVMLRPHIVCGMNIRAPMNPLLLIGAYAALCKARGEALSFPGHPDAYNTLYQATDADLLGEAGVWALQSERKGVEAYNITNGDLFRWRRVWQQIATELDMPLAAPAHRSLPDFIEQNTTLWQELAKQHNLIEADPLQLGDWRFAEYIMSCPWDIAANTVKARLHGFNACRDSLEM